MGEESYITPEAIKKFRSEKNLSQRELASILNVGIADLSRWESGLK